MIIKKNGENNVKVWHGLVTGTPEFDYLYMP